MPRASTTSITGRSEQAGEVGGRAAAVGSAVEQAHHALAEHQVDPRPPRRQQAGQRLDAHRPAVEVDAGGPVARAWKHRVEIVRADLERSRPRAAAPSARRSASVSVVLPLPEAGAARMIRARSWRCLGAHRALEEDRSDLAGTSSRNRAGLSRPGKRAMGRTRGELRRGWTTGACAAAAAKAAYVALLTGRFPDPVTIRLPGGEQPRFDWPSGGCVPEATAAVIKDAGDDPDVTHGSLVRATVAAASPAPG